MAKEGRLVLLLPVDMLDEIKQLAASEQRAVMRQAQVLLAEALAARKVKPKL